ncbi:reprolysin-like metallopeptidase [Sungkyunkwania multivorans]|uniref:Reprolysin-like metallopeptidase n=1 Tax=Sungkyunkwania multivorans TaxID=1173618 RepID=A0ABW3CV34_9FLAO
MKTNLRYVFSITLFLMAFSAFGQNSYWTRGVFEDGTQGVSLRNLDSKEYEVYQLDIDAFKQQLANAPLRGQINGRSTTKISFPNEKGQLELFNVVEVQTLSLEMAARYPNIKTYLGTNQNGARIRFSVTPLGVSTMLNRPDAIMTFMQPITKGSNQYIAYNRSAKGMVEDKVFNCESPDTPLELSNNSNAGRDANDQILRTFRLALSTTGEYTNFWGDDDDTNGTNQEDALAAAVSTLNRNNEVFEVDMAVTFTLVTGTEIIYPDASTDPYTGSFNSQLQSTLTAEVGEANYDIGHLFNFGGNNGNAGCIGCVCVDGQKGSGFSSHSFLDNDGGPYMPDFFDIDYVPHEIGHQMGANHTWSFNSEGTGVNMEPGSGTTIMGYAGITGGNDVQDHSDPYFHYASIDQILNNLGTRTCWTATAITNNPPVADAGTDVVIPAGTAFVLEGSATDADSGDTLTYTWEQIDNGVTTNGTFGPTKTSGAVWRSRPPSTDPNRYMPILQRVAAGQLTETNPVETVDNTSWETVSTVSRALNFALIVRDRSEAGGVGQMPQSSFDTMTVTVDDTAGPFAVTSQTATETWNVGTTQTITWDVAGTDGGAVNAANVDIMLSRDSGLSFPFTIATGLPNNGTANVSIPATGGDTSTARIMVKASDNIFFAVNSADITIQESEFVLDVSNPTVDVCSPADAVYNLTYRTFLGFSGTTTFSAVGLPAGASASFSPATADTDGTAVTATISGIGSVAPGSYPFTLEGTSGSLTKATDVTLNVFDTNFSTLTLTAPAAGATDVFADMAMFEWSADSNATEYDIEIASDAGFSSIVDSATLSTTSYSSTALATGTAYWWRVRPKNDCGDGAFASSNFETAVIICASYDAADTPLAIPDSDPDGVTSTAFVGQPIEITDVNVTINVTHTWDADLTITITSPSGTTVELTSGNGGSGDNYTNTVFDDDATTPITAGSAPFTGSFQPEGSLAAFNGEISNGDWILSASDSALFDTGTIDSWSIEVCGEPLPDADNDSITDDFDNCPNNANVDQADNDLDGIGDACDNDNDNDGIPNSEDNCPFNFNPAQVDSDGDGVGDVCQEDCTTSAASGAVPVSVDNVLPAELRVEVAEDVLITDINVTIDISHTWVSDLTIALKGPDGTTVILADQVCGSNANVLATFDDEGAPLSCGSDPAIIGVVIPGESLSAFNGKSSAGNWDLIVIDSFAGDDGTINSVSLEICGADADIDEDGVINSEDNCPSTPNPDQADFDADGFGDACDDRDNDGVFDAEDNCPDTPNPTQQDLDADGLGDICDDEITFVEIPDALTPNGDGVNDTWVVGRLDLFPGNSVKVFNRWGQEVLSERNYQNDWNGQAGGGDKLPSGSYYYIVDIFGDGRYTFDGWIYLTY